MDIEKGNRTLLNLTNRYQNIPYESLKIPVPYFINTAEQAYTQAMKEVGIGVSFIKKTIQFIKDGKTLLGSGGGKGSPEQITEDLKRLMESLVEQGYHPTTVGTIRKWMKEMHVGLDCSGYIYNILVSIEKAQSIETLRRLAWADPESTKPSHAGAFIFDSKNLREVKEYADLLPLDLFIRRDHTHVGILTEIDGNLFLADCSMGKGGITYSRLHLSGNDLVVENYDSWTSCLRDGGVIIRRLEL